MTYVHLIGTNSNSLQNSITFPIAPESIQIKIKNQNKVLTLIDGSEINVPMPAGLTEYKLNNILLGLDSTVQPSSYLEKLQNLKISRKPIAFIVDNNINVLAKQGVTIDTLVTVEDYSVDMSSDEAINHLLLSITLKKYVEYGTTSVNIKTNKAKTKNTRPEKTQTEKTTYTVKQGDTLWSIAKKFYGDGSKYMAIYNANKDKIKNPNLIYPGQVLIIPDASTAASTSSKSTSASAKKTNAYTNASDSVTIKPSKKATQLETLADKNILGIAKVKENPKSTETKNYHGSIFSDYSSGSSGSSDF